MPNLQEIFDRIKESQKKQKDLKDTFRDALASSAKYQEIAEKLNTIKEKKKSIEEEIKSSFNSEFNKLESVKLDIQTDKELLSDAALTSLMKGQTVEIHDQYDNEYEPIFSVKFKKV